MNSKLLDIKSFLEDKTPQSFKKAVVYFSTYIDDNGGEIDNISKYILYDLFDKNSEYVLDYIHVNPNRVKSSNQLEDSIFYSVADYMRGDLVGTSVNKKILINQITKIILMDTNIDNIIKIRNVLGEMLYYKYEKLLEISAKTTQEFYNNNTTLLGMKCVTNSEVIEAAFELIEKMENLENVSISEKLKIDMILTLCDNIKS